MTFYEFINFRSLNFFTPLVPRHPVFHGLFLTGQVLMNMTFFLLAVDGPEGHATSGSVQRFFGGPGRIPAVQVAEFHVRLLS
jgi:hypothetical protein